MSVEEAGGAKNSRKTVWIGICLGALFWIAGAAVGAFALRESDLIRNVFMPGARELAMRVLVLCAMFGFAVSVKRVMERRKLFETKLSESEQRYRDMIDRARDVVYTLDADGAITSLNPAFETTTGWPRKEMLGKNFLAIVHPDDAARAIDVVQRALAGQTPELFELRIKTRSGEYLTGEFMGSPFFRDGRVSGTQGIARDITQRKMTDRALLDSEAKYRDLFENANDLIQSVGADGRFLYVNRAWRETLGYTDAEVAGLTFVDVLHPDSREHCVNIFGRLMAGEKIGNVEARFVTKSGRTVIVEGNINNSIVDGSPVATRGIFRDVTEHRRAVEFVRHILESLDEGFVVIDREYRIVAANKAYMDKFAAPLTDVVGRHCYSAAHHLSKPCHEAGEECAARRTFQTGAPCTVVHVHHDKDGSLVYVEVKSLPLKDAMGKVESAIEIYHDISEKKKLEDQLRHAQKMEAIGTLAGGIAHDFNNILTAIIGYSTLLQMRTCDNEILRSYVDQILTSTERAAALTQGLLAFSRKQPVLLRAVDLNKLVAHVQQLVMRLIGEDIDVRLEPAAQQPIVRADSGQLEQVLVNLVTNARDAMPHGGALTLRTAVAEFDLAFIKAHGYGTVGAFAVLSVVDTGTGIAEKTRERIFEPFFTTKEIGKGTGLGLSIVYGIVKQHGGFIDVVSEPGKGTEVTIYLPLAAAAVEAAVPAEPVDVEGGTETILVGEDDEGVRRLTRSVLEGVGYRVIEAVDGEDAVRQFMDHRDAVDLLFLDIIMPKQNGNEAYVRIKKIRPDISVLFASGYPVEMLQAKSIINDTLPFIAKPVAPRDLLLKVKSVLNNGRDTAPRPDLGGRRRAS